MTLPARLACMRELATGGGRGIWAAIARGRLAGDGAAVAVSYVADRVSGRQTAMWYATTQGVVPHVRNHGMGVIGRDLRTEQATVDQMTETMSCRGPDDRGTWFAEHAALGHRRLPSSTCRAAASR